MRSFVHILFVILLLLVPSVADAANQGDHALASDYVNGHFHTSVMYDVDASYTDLVAVLDEIFVGMQTQPTKNLKWLWKGLGRKKEVDGDMNMREKGVYYDHTNQDYQLNLEVGMANQTPETYIVEGKLRSVPCNGKYIVGMSVTKKIKTLNDADFVITAVPYNWNRSRVYVRSSVAFGWLFNLFFTQERYKSMLEWRIDGLGLNIKNRAENKTK